MPVTTRRPKITQKDTERLFVEFAQRHYWNPQTTGNDEFSEDLKRFRTVARLIARYQESRDHDDLREPQVINHIKILRNVFGVEATLELLGLRVARQHWPTLYAFYAHLGLPLPGKAVPASRLVARLAELYRED